MPVKESSSGQFEFCCDMCLYITKGKRDVPSCYLHGENTGAQYDDRR